MSDISAGQSVNRDDVDEADDAPSAALDREANRLLAEDRVIAASNAGDLGAPQSSDARELGLDGPQDGATQAGSIRQSLRADGETARGWATSRQERLQAAIREEPVRATAYALGLGILIGLLIAR